MNTLSHLLRCTGHTDGITYQRNVGLLALAKTVVDLMMMAHDNSIDVRVLLGAWINPFLLITPWLAGTMPTLICVSTFIFYSALVWNSVHRARHAGWPTWTVSIVMVPYAGALMTIILALLPARKHTVWDLI